MKMSMRALRAAVCWSVSAALAFAPAVAYAQENVGSAAKVVNAVSGTLSDNVRTIVLQDNVFQNEIIATSGDSATELLFRDETQLTVGPDSQVTLDTFVYDPSATAGRLVISMSVGAMRFVSGKMAQQSYEVRTPTATIGIRGTIFTVVVAANGLTTVSVVEGAVAITNVAGVSVSVQSGLSSSVSPASAGVTPPPSPPGPTPLGAQNAVNQMNQTIARAPGAPAGGAASSAATGGLTTGVIAAGLAAAALAALAITSIVSDDDIISTSTTTTTTSTTSTGTAP